VYGVGVDGESEQDAGVDRHAGAVSALTSGIVKC
jgi:hypothetical protein